MRLVAWNMSSGTVEIHAAGCSHNPDSGRSKFRTQDQVEFGEIDWLTKYDFAYDYWDNGILEEYEAEPGNGPGSFDVWVEMDFKPCTKSFPVGGPDEIAVDKPAEALDSCLESPVKITKRMREYHAWLEAKTGRKLDIETVVLAGALRAEFQEERRSSK
jgi:hypothetical protein